MSRSQSQRRGLRAVPSAPSVSTGQALWQAMRPYQWTKNLLLLVPVLMAKKEGELALDLQAAIAFAAFCLTASSVYIGNDILDRDTDRKHPEKKRRPFAAGLLSATIGWSTASALLLAGLGLGAWLSLHFVGLLLGYIATNVVYSLWLKKAAILDVLVLAGFYCLRLFAGALAVNVPISEWLLAFSLFLFFSLALAKRVSELMLTQGKTPGRGYGAADTAQLAIFGSASGYLAVLVYALFINSAHVQSYYSRPFFLWLIFPILLYWISRIWLIANRGDLDSDPLVFTLRDRASQGMVVAALVAVLLARGLIF